MPPMTAPATRGSWSVHEAVSSRWYSKGIDAAFRDIWNTEKDSQQFLTLNDTEARPAKQIGSGQQTVHPMPFCIFEHDTPIILGHSSGGAATETEQLAGQNADVEQQYQDIPIQFVLYDFTKERAIAAAKIVAAVFDKALLDVSPDRQIDMFRDPDFGARLDSRTWTWTLQYRVRIDATYAADLS